MVKAVDRRLIDNLRDVQSVSNTYGPVRQEWDGPLNVRTRSPVECVTEGQH